MSRIFAVKFVNVDGKDFVSNTRYNLPRGAIAGAWHSPNGQKKRIEIGGTGYESFYGDGIVTQYRDVESYYESARIFIVELGGRIDVDNGVVSSEKIRFIKEIKTPHLINSDDYLNATQNKANIAAINAVTGSYNILDDQYFETLEPNAYGNVRV